MTRVLAIVLLAAAAVGCGGGGSDDDEAVRDAVVLFFARKEPRGCDVQTDRFLRNRVSVANLAAARRQCRKDESGAPASDDQLDPGIEPQSGAAVSSTLVDGARAEAKATLQDGDFGGQAINVFLVKQGGDWKIDRLDGLVISAFVRDKIDRWIFRWFRGIHAAADKGDAIAECVVDRSQRALPNHRLAMLWEGQLPPGSFNSTLDHVGRSCVRDATAQARR